MRAAVLAVAICLLAGCETRVVPEATSGSRVVPKASSSSRAVPKATSSSRADGAVRLSFEYAMLRKPVVNWSEAKASATKRCAAWGYSGAEKFEASARKCVARNAGGVCLSWGVTITCQCTGKRA